MNFKKLALAGAMVVTCGFANPAAASDRLSMNDVYKFVGNLTAAINNPNASVGRDFLHSKVATNASYHNTLNTHWADGRWAYHVNNGYYGSPYYRYPYSYGYNLQPTSQTSADKSGLIRDFDRKKMAVPGFNQTVDIMSTKMPADASSAVLDIRLKEYGVGYVLAPYGQRYDQKVEISDARCYVHLKKRSNDVKMTHMNCNTIMRQPYL